MEKMHFFLKNEESEKKRLDFIMLNCLQYYGYYAN